MTAPEKHFVLSHVVKNVSELTEDRQYSAVEDHFNVPWKLGYRRFGNMFSLHLFCEKLQDQGEPWAVTTNYDLKVVSIDGSMTTRDAINYTFGTGKEYNGYGDNVILWETLLSDHVMDNTIIIEAHVTLGEMTGIEKTEKIRNFDVGAKEFSDLVLKIDKEKFYVSKLSLVTQSTYFKSLLMGKFKEAKKSEVVLKNINPADFQIFLELIYLDPTLTDNNIENVMVLTDMYDAKNATRLCEQFLMNDSKHSLRTKLRIAVRYQLQQLKKHCLDNLKCRADVRAVMGDDLNQLDASISNELLKKTLSFK